MLSDRTKEILRAFFLVIFLITVMVLITQAIGLGKGGFEHKEILQAQFFYIAPAIGFLIGIIAIIVVEIVILKDDKYFGNSVCFSSPGEMPAITANFMKSTLKIALLCLIIFSIMGIFTAYTKQTFTGVGVLGQQFTVTDNLLYSAALVPAAENLGAAFTIALTIFLIRYYARKLNWAKETFWGLSLVLAPLSCMIYGIVMHMLRYGFNEVALYNVLIFWLVGGLITVLTGSFIPFYIMHMANNFFFDITKYFSNEVIIIYSVAFIVIMIIFYSVIYFKKGAPEEQTSLAVS